MGKGCHGTHKKRNLLRWDLNILYCVRFTLVRKSLIVYSQNATRRIMVVPGLVGPLDHKTEVKNILNE